MTTINDAAVTTLGRKIRTARTIAGMKQEELARRVGVSRSAVGQWESDDTEPSALKLIAIARHTMQPLGWFAEGIDLDRCARRESNSQPSVLELDREFWAIVGPLAHCQDTPDNEMTHSAHPS